MHRADRLGPRGGRRRPGPRGLERRGRRRAAPRGGHGGRGERRRPAALRPGGRRAHTAPLSAEHHGDPEGRGGCWRGGGALPRPAGGGGHQGGRELSDAWIRALSQQPVPCSAVKSLVSELESASRAMGDVGQASAAARAMAFQGFFHGRKENVMFTQGPGVLGSLDFKVSLLSRHEEHGNVCEAVQWV